MEIPIEVECCFDPKRKTEENKLFMTMVGATISDKDGNKVGSIDSIIPVGLQITSEKTKRAYTFDIKDLFAKILEAEEKGEF